jgi:cytochrome c peroxidase
MSSRLTQLGSWLLPAVVAVLSVTAVAVHPASLLGAAAPADETLPYARHLPLYRRPDTIPAASGNAHSAERWALGRALFFDPRLSGAGDVSCASCHVPSKGWEDGRPTAVGTRQQRLGRHTPTILNTAWAAALFWDGRAETLEEQALGPIQAAGEMNMPLDSLVGRMNASPEYKAMFRRAYPGSPITAEVIAKAIGVFERSVVSGQAPFDRWVSGDESAVSPAAKRGFVLFNEKASCASCHSGWRFTDDSFQDIGVAGADSGRGRLLPGIEAVQFAFKTPTLRNIAERAPYMHDGSERTLEQVVELYDQGGRVRRASVSPLVKPLHLTAPEKRDLVAFLRTLSSNDPVVTAPALPR